MAQPVRTCVGCRHTDEQRALERFVLADNVVVPDPTGSAPGRGAWVHPDEQCRAQAVRRGGFARSFRRQVRLAPEVDWAEPPATR